jgi:hypothetical protein
LIPFNVQGVHGWSLARLREALLSYLVMNLISSPLTILASIFISATSLSAGKISATAQGATEAKLKEADSLYEQYRRTDSLDPLKRAISILDELAQADQNNYAVAWRRSRAYYHIGDDTHGNSEKLRLFDQAMQAGTHATELNPGGAEGHYWLGVSDGGYGEVKGMFKALSLTKSIRKEMETVIRINPSYESAGAYVVLGRMDFELPGLLGGSKKRAIQEYQDGLRLSPNPLLKVYLADSLIDDGQKDQAKSLLDQVLGERSGDPNLRDAQQEAKKIYARNFK